MVKQAQQEASISGGAWVTARRVLARTLFKEMKDEGLSPHQMVEFTNELLGLVGDEMHDTRSRHVN